MSAVLRIAGLVAFGYAVGYLLGACIDGVITWLDRNFGT